MHTCFGAIGVGVLAGGGVLVVLGATGVDVGVPIAGIGVAVLVEVGMTVGDEMIIGVGVVVDGVPPAAMSFRSTLLTLAEFRSCPAKAMLMV